MQKIRSLLLKFIFSLVAMLLVTSAHATYYPRDGIWLLHNCQKVLKVVENNLFTSFQENISMGQCFGYLNALYDAGIVYHCSAKAILPEQGIRVILNYLKDNPEKLNLDAITLIRESFSKAWPCKK